MEKIYDVVVVGGGIAGSIMANELGRQGKSVLVLEAGTGQGLETEGQLDGKYNKGYEAFMESFFTAEAKIPNSPYVLPKSDQVINPDAPQPTVLEPKQIHDDVPDTDGYFVQKGPLPFLSTYTRSLGGTTLHWLGTCLRMLPDDFKQKSIYGHGRDWPIPYDELMPYYDKAEFEIGVSANVEEQGFLGIKFSEDYVYPMYKIPQSYLDDYLSKGLKGMTVEFDGQTYPLEVVSTPQGRNGMPNPNYDGGQGFRPVGAVGDPELGQRCAGNSNCVPICPIQAKYNALKTLEKALKTGNVEIQNKSVASRVMYDENGKVTGIEVKRYHDPLSPNHTTHVVKGKIYVLTAHAAENAKLLLASGIHSTSGQVGKNLMDHPVLLTWGLMPDKIGSFRGPGSTSGIPSLRNGTFRKNRGAFRVEIGNWGWNWAAGDPYTLIQTAVDERNMFGKELRRHVNDISPRQFRFGFLVEQPPDPANAITIDPNYKDQLGNYRPVVQYNLTDYTKSGIAAAKNTSDLIFQRMGVEDFTQYNPQGPGYFEFQGQNYEFQGAGHLAGTHLMGTTKHNSVVDKHQRSWDHENLFLTGCGSMPTIATSNPTLTMAALAFQAAENVLNDLNQC